MQNNSKKKKKKLIIDFNHISNRLSKEEIDELTAYYMSYHKKKNVDVQKSIQKIQKMGIRWEYFIHCICNWWYCIINCNQWSFIIGSIISFCINSSLYEA